MLNSLEGLKNTNDLRYTSSILNHTSVQSLAAQTANFFGGELHHVGTLVPVGSKPVLGLSGIATPGWRVGYHNCLCPRVASAVHAYNSPQVTLMPKFQLRCRVLQHKPQTFLAANCTMLAPLCQLDPSPFWAFPA